MTRLIYVASLALLLALPAAAQRPRNLSPDCCTSRYPVAQLAAYPTAQLGAEYRRLRRQRCQACDRYGSDFQQLLKELGTRLAGTTRPAIRRALGRPDARVGTTYRYYWRGTHDYLYFDFAQGAARSDWYYAFE